MVPSAIVLLLRDLSVGANIKRRADICHRAGRAMRETDVLAIFTNCAI